MLDGVGGGLTADGDERLGHGGRLGQAADLLDAHAHQLEGVHDRSQLGGRLLVVGTRKVLHHAAHQLRDLVERLRVAAAVLKVAMQDGETLADGVVHARLHMQHGLVARDLADARKRLLQLAVCLLEQAVRARDGDVEALLLRDVDGRKATVGLAVDLSGVALEQPHVVFPDLDAHALGQHVVYGRRAAFRDLAQVLPQHADVGQVGGEAKLHEAPPHGVVHVQHAPAFVRHGKALGQAVDGLDGGKPRDAVAEPPNVQDKPCAHAERQERGIGYEQVRREGAGGIDDGWRACGEQHDLPGHHGFTVAYGKRQAHDRQGQVEPEQCA